MRTRRGRRYAGLDAISIKAVILAATPTPKLSDILAFRHPPIGDPWVVAFAINDLSDQPAKATLGALLKAQKAILTAQMNFITEVERILARP